MSALQISPGDMPQIHPSGWRELAVTGAALREIETLALLEKALPAGYVVYHGVHWTRVEKTFSAYGEIDFIIVAPNGRVLLIEQKSGFLDETPEGLVKKYQGKHKNVHNQIVRMVQTLLTKFNRDGEQLSIDYLLYCPDYTVKKPSAAGIDAARIVDASRRDRLISIICDILPATEIGAQRAKVMRFVDGLLELVPDASALVGRAEQMVTRLSGGLASWARQLEFSPWRLRVLATAGSGKTQLAMAEYRATLEAGGKPLYVCYNRPWRTICKPCCRPAERWRAFIRYATPGHARLAASRITAIPPCSGKWKTCWPRHTCRRTGNTTY